MYCHRKSIHHENFSFLSKLKIPQISITSFDDKKTKFNKSVKKNEGLKTENVKKNCFFISPNFDSLHFFLNFSCSKKINLKKKNWFKKKKILHFTFLLLRAQVPILYKIR